MAAVFFYVDGWKRRWTWGVVEDESGRKVNAMGKGSDEGRWRWEA